MSICGSYLLMLMRFLYWNNINSGAEVRPPTMSPWHHPWTVPMASPSHCPILAALPVPHTRLGTKQLSGVPCQGYPLVPHLSSLEMSPFVPLPQIYPYSQHISTAHNQFLPCFFPIAPGSLLIAVPASLFWKGTQNTALYSAYF